MTLLEKLSHKVDTILDRHHELKSENIRLKKQLKLLSNADDVISQLQKEKQEQDKTLETLIFRLEQLLKNRNKP
jgi:DNA repair ATPase RecN